MTTIVMRGDFLGNKRIEDSLQMLGYPEDTWKEVITRITYGVEDELPYGVTWNPYASELVGEYGKDYSLAEDDIKALIERKSLEVREETEDWQKDEDWFNDHSELEISGEFGGVNERYTDSFKNRREFEYILEDIARNSACCHPDRIYGDETEDNLPGYVDEWLEEAGAEYINRSSEEWSGDGPELEISGEFEGVNECYTDTFRNRKEFEYILEDIGRNSACCYPNRIYGGIEGDKLPKYVTKWMKVTGAEYINRCSEEWSGEGPEITISGFFVGINERYYDTFRNREEFEWALRGIDKNGACCVPDRIYGDKAEDKLPKYVRDWLKATEAEYIEEEHSGD